MSNPKNNGFWGMIAGAVAGIIAAIIAIISSRPKAPQDAEEQRQERRDSDIQEAETEAEEQIEEIKNMSDEEVIEKGTTPEQQEAIETIVTKATDRTMKKLDRFKKKNP